MMGVTQTSSSQEAYKKAQELGLTLTSGKRTRGSLGVPWDYDFHGVGRAYDFAGPKSAMDQFAAWAKSSGLFTEILYGADVKHDDHVHLAWGPTLYKGREGQTYLGNGKYIPKTKTDDNVLQGADGPMNGPIKQPDVKGIIPNVTRFVLLLVFLVAAFLFFIGAFPAVKIQ